MRSMEARRRLVERLEREVHVAPARYRLKLALLAALGYAVLAVSLAMTLGVAVFLVLYVVIVRPPADPMVVIPILMLGTVGVVILRALWIRFSEPDGHRLQPGEAPGLREEVERIRRQVGAERLHGIVIDDALNAAAAYVPSGVGLWNQRHYLVLGLPLLQLLNRSELAAVIAHEFGHFHGGHGRFGAWIYRLRSSWYRLMEGVASGGWSVGQLLGLFFRWYAPYFDAYSFVLARRQEYAADAVGAAVAGERAMASALVRVGLAADWLQRDFWPGVHRSEQDQSYPPAHVHGRLSSAIREHRRTHEGAPRWLLERDAGLDDTHPTLAQRLNALKIMIAPRPDSASDHSAADLLGEVLHEKLEQRFSREWHEAAKREWEARHRQWELERRRLTELEAHNERSPAEWVEYAALAEAHRLAQDALTLYREALARSPSHVWTRYRLGALLLKRGDEAEGIECLQRAMESNAAVIEPALQSLEEHARTQPDDSNVFTVMAALRKRYGAGIHDGNRLETDAEWLPHALDAVQMQGIARVFRGFEKIAEAWIVLQPAGGTSALPHYLVLVRWTGSVVSESVGLERLADQLRLPGTFTIVTTTTQAALARQIRSKAGEPAYQRPR
ncbi:M48 family metalloprotease [Pseudoxanthomonas sp. UTMC 1351]|uniref:M48 family metalloprotease n=1 Tax=Pseudoxanthomonas sp. UTMC 1351 TaxID=2695853 RepID=UPI0034CD441B